MKRFPPWVKNCGAGQWLPTRVTGRRVPGLQGSPRRGEGRVEMSSKPEKPGVPGSELARPVPGRQGAGRRGVLTSRPENFLQSSGLSPPRGPVRSRTVPQPHDPTHPASLPSCRSSRTVAAAAREPRAPGPAPAPPPPPPSPSMLSGPAVMTSEGPASPGDDANSRRHPLRPAHGSGSAG